MKFINPFVVFILILAIHSCQGNKAVSETMKKSEEKMIEEGFKKATVVYSSLPNDCEYTLAIEGEKTLFDPINLEVKFKKSQEKVWVKYTPLRMPNRCEKANPVELTDIYPRK